MVKTALLTPIEEIQSLHKEDAQALLALSTEAKRFLLSHKWCRHINKGYLGIGWAELLAVFYFDFVAAGKAPTNTWVVVGDIPPAYIDTESRKTPDEAIEGYVEELEYWTTAARRGDVSEAMPLRTRFTYDLILPNPESIDLVVRRVRILKKILAESASL